MPNREILFRGKRKNNSKWVEGFYFENFDKCYIMSTKYLDNPITKFIFEVIPETVGQFTGLHDKNGKEIFEGDIVKTIAHSCEFTGSIEYSINHIRFVCVTKSKITYPMDSSFEYEVMGNIHDNPELLKEE